MLAPHYESVKNSQARKQHGDSELHFRSGKTQKGPLPLYETDPLKQIFFTNKLLSVRELKN